MSDRYFSCMTGATRFREISKEDWSYAENMAGIMSRGGQPQRKQFEAAGIVYRTWDGRDPRPEWLGDTLPAPSLAPSQVQTASGPHIPLESKGSLPVGGIHFAPAEQTVTLPAVNTGNSGSFMTPRLKIMIDDVLSERNRQDAKWGGIEHDITHSPNDWAAYVVRHLGRATIGAEIQDGREYRKRLVEVAALAVAAIEAYDVRQARTTAQCGDARYPY